MNINDYIKIKKLPSKKDYALAEQGNGFVVPGPNFIASISPGETIHYIALPKVKYARITITKQKLIFNFIRCNYQC